MTERECVASWSGGRVVRGLPYTQATGMMKQWIVSGVLGQHRCLSACLSASAGTPNSGLNQQREKAAVLLTISMYPVV